jgi:hypothetical protein
MGMLSLLYRDVLGHGVYRLLSSTYQQIHFHPSKHFPWLYTHSAYSDDFGSFLRLATFAHIGLYTVKKLFLAKESFVCDILAGDGKIANLFSQCIYLPL